MNETHKISVSSSQEKCHVRRKMKNREIRTTETVVSGILENRATRRRPLLIRVCESSKMDVHLIQNTSSPKSERYLVRVVRLRMGLTVAQEGY